MYTGQVTNEQSLFLDDIGLYQSVIHSTDWLGVNIMYLSHHRHLHHHYRQRSHHGVAPCPTDSSDLCPYCLPTRPDSTASGCWTVPHCKDKATTLRTTSLVE